MARRSPPIAFTKSDIQITFFIIPIIVLLFGIAGNCINVAIFAKKKMRQTSTFRYLLYLSISDLFVLTFACADVLIKSNSSFELRGFSLFPCNIQKFLAYSFNYISSFLLVAVSIERALIISFFDNSNQQNTSRIKSFLMFFLACHKQSVVDSIVLLIVASMLIINAHFIFALKPSSLVYFERGEGHALNKTTSSYEILACVPVKSSYYEKFLTHAWHWVDLGLYSVIPFVSISTCSLVIIRKLREMNQSYVQRLNSNPTKASVGVCLAKLKRNAQISLMLVSSSAYFLFTTLIFWLWFFERSERKETLESNLVQSLVYMLLYSNNAFGILFYSCSSEKYRRTFMNCFRCNDLLASSREDVSQMFA